MAVGACTLDLAANVGFRDKSLEYFSQQMVIFLSFIRSNDGTEKMKSILRIRSMNYLFVAFAFVAFAQSGYAQIGNDFPAADQPIIDSAVMRTDFQRDVEPPAQPLEFAVNFGASDSDSHSSDEANSLIGGIKKQFADLDLPRVFGSLAIVLGGYFGLIWFTRRFSGRGSGKLPNEVVEVLGQTPFKPGYQLQLIRLGSKLLLLMNGPEGTHTIGEISDAAEVARLCAACGVSKPVSRMTPAKPPTPAPTTAPVPTVPPATSGPNTDLKQILRQLQRVADDAGNGAVFEA